MREPAPSRRNCRCSSFALASSGSADPPACLGSGHARAGRFATTAVSLPPASERLDIENSETAPNRPRQEPRSRQSTRSLAPESVALSVSRGGSTCASSVWSRLACESQAGRPSPPCPDATSGHRATRVLRYQACAASCERERSRSSRWSPRPSRTRRSPAGWASGSRPEDLRGERARGPRGANRAHARGDRHQARTHPLGRRSRLPRRSRRARARPCARPRT